LLGSPVLDVLSKNMQNKFPLAASLSTIAAMAVLHHLSLEYKLYFKVHWLDVFVHFIAGMGIVFLIIGIFHYSRSPRIQAFIYKKECLLIIGALLALSIGILWEIFEIWVGVIFASSYFMDTFIDIVADVSGGVLAAGLYSFTN